MIIWLVGLSGVGKSRIGHALYLEMKSKNVATIFIDGDNVRTLFKYDKKNDYSIEARRESALRLQALCTWFNEEGLDVVCCAISLFQDINDANKKIFENYKEVFVDVPLEILIQRDNKGLYQQALAGNQANVVGIDIPYTPPTSADLVIKNTYSDDDIPKFVNQILTECGDIS